MSKLSFRARHLDPSKQMPIYLAEELPDLPEYSAINRAVPQMPSGMEKEEESEHHLQRAICTGLIIPTPEVLQTNQPFYDAYYPPDYKMPRQMIHMQLLGLDTEVPDYDMDSADEEWLSQQQRLDLNELKFEQMMDRLEKSSGQTVVTLNEAKALLNMDDETNIAVYDYWLNKRLKMQHPLILTVKTESRPGASSNNPYLAFRRRTEKMQTRKNRKNDEASYEKMLKLRRDLQRATTILEIVKCREETKRDQLKTTVEIFEKRVELRDFNGAVYNELNAQYKSSRPAYNSLYTNQYSQGSAVAAGAAGAGTTATGALLAAGGVGMGVLPATIAAASQYLTSSNMTMDNINANSGGVNHGSSSRKEKRPYKKRKHKLPRDKHSHQQQQHQQPHHHQHQHSHTQQPHPQQQQQYLPGLAQSSNASGASSAHHLSHLHHLNRQSASPAAGIDSTVDSEEDEYLGSGGGTNGIRMGSESEDEAPFAFRRKLTCNYLRIRQQEGRWPWETPDDELEPNNIMTANAKYRYTLTSLNYPRPRCIGFARRRLGRGGRVVFDRASTNFDDFWSQLDYTVMESVVPNGPEQVKQEPLEQELLIKPCSPPTVVDLVPKPASLLTTPLLPHDSVKKEALMDLEKPSLPETADHVKDDELDGHDEEEHDEDDLLTEDENVSRLSIYSSAVTLPQSPHDLRLKRRRLRRKKQQMREINAAKRMKCITAAPEEKSNGEGASEDACKPSLKPLPRSYLHRFVQAMNSFDRPHVKEEKEQQQETNDIEKEKEKELAMTPANQDLEPELVPRVNHQHHHHRSNNNNNNTVLNNNNSSSNSNMNKNVSISEKFNVIKMEAQDDEDEQRQRPQQQQQLNISEAVGESASVIDEQPVASTSAAAAAARAAEAAAAAVAGASVASVGSAEMEEVAKTIKRELIDADDSNEPLSSIRTLATTSQQAQPQTQLEPDSDPMDDEAEDDVNLAQLSNIIRHTAVKKERQALQQKQQEQYRAQREREEDCKENESYNQLPDVIRLRNIRNARHLHLDANPIEDDGLDVDYLGSLSPTSSQRLDICNELLSEIRRDWLHFRPKTPTDELSDDATEIDIGDCKLSDGMVDWTQDTPISVELNRLGNREKMQGTEDSEAGSYFLTSAFKFSDLDSDAQLLQPISSPQDDGRGSSKSPNCSGSGSGSALEFNLSGGDSLNDINNLLGDDEDDNDEHMLDNILQECAMDDPKALNQATNFWNGILDGEAAVDEVDETAADQLLDCITEKKQKVGGAVGELTSRRAGRHRRPKLFNGPWGSSTFTVCPTVNSLREKDIFFSQVKEITKEEPQPTEEPTPTPPPAPCMPIKEEKEEIVIADIIAPSAPTPVVATPTPPPPPSLMHLPAQIISQKPPLTSTPTLTAVSVPVSSQPQQQQVTQLLNQIAPQIIARTEYSGGAAVGDIVTITPHLGSSPLTVAANTSSSSSPSAALTAQQQLQHQLAQAQLRNVTVQQRQATPQQQQQQQLLFQMQREINTTPVITSSTRSLTPLSAGTGNHMIYTTSSGELISATNSGQKVTYAIQKATSGGATTAGNSVGGTTIGPNTVITLSNVKLQSEDNSVGGGSTGSSVNIINTSSGQQLAVHSIAGLQQQTTQQVQQQTTTTPLIVTTPARNNVQQQQHQQQQPQLVQQQPIVWRQVSGTNTAVATTAVLSTTQDSSSPAAVGNKILWTSRPTGQQKRQVNGPENTDINKLLLNRKFSQRKLVSQSTVGQQGPQQIQLTKQQLQQLVQQDDNDLVATTTGNVGEEVDISALIHTAEIYDRQARQKIIKMAGNSAAAIAANHNYSLQPPPALISTQTAPQQANKIFLTSSNSSGGGGNFTIATASELQAAAAVQKRHYKELPNSNLKLNFVSSSGGTVGVTGVGGETTTTTLVAQAPQQVGATTVLLNKATGAQLQAQQQVVGAGQHQKLKMVTTGNSQTGGDKRVLYTSVVNVKPLQKNNSGQMQMQLGPSGLQQVLRGRLNNSAIFTRTLPLGTTVNSTGGGNGGGATATTIRQLVTTNNANNVSSSDGAIINAKDMGKTLTVEQVIASANNGGVVLPTNQANNNNNNGGSSGDSVVSAVSSTTSTTNATGVGTGAAGSANAMTSTINR